MMKSFSILGAVAAVSFALASTVSAATIGGNSSGVAPNSGGWSWDGIYYSDVRSALEDPTKYGPAGTTGGETVTTVDLATPDAAGLSTLDIFVSTWWRDDDAAPYVTDVVDWFLSGGNLFVLADDPDRDSIINVLGLATINGTANPTTMGGTIANGSFGAIASVVETGNVGHFDNATILGLGGEIFGTDANGDATIAGFEAGTFSPTSGRLLIMGDTDLISTYGAADYDALNSNAVLGLNSFEYLLNAPAPVPLPAALPIMMTGLGGLVLMGRRRKKT